MDAEPNIPCLFKDKRQGESGLLQQLRQLGDVGRDPPGLVTE